LDAVGIYQADEKRLDEIISSWLSLVKKGFTSGEG
jgi:hypothetical protein